YTVIETDRKVLNRTEYYGSLLLRDLLKQLRFVVADSIRPPYLSKNKCINTTSRNLLQNYIFTELDFNFQAPFYFRHLLIIP
ncbi:MAG: hypothetical protein LUG95_05620, partial [Clostridiales bacterium]|nr:hypothetical protein [Clostridiales bacterium]